MSGQGNGGEGARPAADREGGGSKPIGGPEAASGSVEANRSGKESATTVGISPVGRTSAARIARAAIAGGALGAMIGRGLLGLTQTIVAEGGMSFAGWAARVFHDAILQKPGAKLIEAVYGEDGALNLRGDIRTLYILGCLGIAGAVVGCLAGAAAGFFRHRRPAGTAAVSGAETGGGGKLPAGLPLGAAILGLLYHGFVWGNAAVLLLPFSRRGGKVITAATWVVGFAAVLLWAWALEMNWPEGWSKMYP